jgi:hypothetical protein
MMMNDKIRLMINSEHRNSVMMRILPLTLYDRCSANSSGFQDCAETLTLFFRLKAHDLLSS